MNILRPSALCLIATLHLIAGSLAAQDTWTFRSPAPTGNRLASFAYGQDRFVGVGELGDIATSPEGAVWTERESGTTDHLARVTYGANRFVAVGRTSILVSSDGTAWSHQSSPAALTDIAYGNGTYVALAAPATDGGNHRFLTSADATTWTLRANVLDPVRVLFAHGVFVAPDSTGRVLASADGRNWTATTVVESRSAIPFFAAGNNRFLLSWGGDVYLSTNGTSWRNITQHTHPGIGTFLSIPELGSRSSLGFADGYFYERQSRYSSPSGVSRSVDGENWTAGPLTPSGLDFGTLASGGGVSVATEMVDGITGANPTAHVIHTSTDGLTWTARTANLESPASAAPSAPRAVYGLGRFFYGGQSSPDGIGWAPTGFEPTHAAGDLVFRLVSGTNAPAPRVSADGITSAAIDVKIPQPRGVASGQGVYVMIGGGPAALSSSTDGVTWTARSSPTTAYLSEIIFAFGRFIAVGDEGTILTSTDGATWTLLPGESFKHFTLRHLVAGPDRLVIAGTALTSDAAAGTAALPDGTPIVLTSAHAFSSLGHVGGGFLAAGISTSPDSSYTPAAVEVWKSTDGSTWTQVPLRVTGLDRTFFSSYGYPTLAVSPDSALLSTRLGASASTTRTYNALLQTLVAPTSPVAPNITDPPASTTVHRGESATFALGATGTGLYTYQWKHDGTTIAGATSPALTLPLATDDAAGSYTVTVTNRAGSATSAAATLTVLPPVPLVIAAQPVSSEVAAYAPATLSVAVSGSGPIAYQWRKDGQPIAGATGSSYTISVGTQQQLTAAAYDVVVTAPYSTVTSAPAQVTWGGLVTSVSSGQVRVPVGGSISITAGAAGAHPPFTYQWGHQSGPDLPGATGATLTLTNVTGPRTASYAVVVSDSAGHHEYASFQLIVVPDGSATLSLAGQPISQTVQHGSPVVLSVSAPPGANYRYQWRRNLQPIPGATSAQLDLGPVTAANATAGDYDVLVYQDDYSAAIVSRTATVAIGSSRLSNLSALGFAGTGEETFFQGFVLHGISYTYSTGPLLRSVGPGLIRLGLQNVLADPRLSVLTAGQTETAANDNWSTRPTLNGLPATAEAMAALGAFPLDPGALDSALQFPANNGGLFIVRASGTDGGTGYVLNEIYGPDYPTLRLVNLSARSRVGDRPLIAGFVIDGDVPLRVLIRGVGPGLAAQGVRTALANPKITLYRGGGAIHNNDNWSQAANLAELRTATSAVGAFALPEGGNDAAMLETLPPGVYSVHVTSVDNSPGIALVEIYDAP